MEGKKRKKQGNLFIQSHTLVVPFVVDPTFLSTSVTGFSTNTKNKKKQQDDHLESETPELTVITSAVNRERNDMDTTSTPRRYFPEPDLRVNDREERQRRRTEINDRQTGNERRGNC